MLNVFVLIIDDYRLDPKYAKLSDVLLRAERYKPSYNQQKMKDDDDIVMANLIRDATTRSMAEHLSSFLKGGCVALNLF